jgi:hypothetical protein
MKSHQLETKLENDLEELNQIQRDLTTSIANKTNQFGNTKLKSFLLKKQNRLAASITELQESIKSRKNEIEDLKIQNDKIVKFLKFKEKYFIPNNIYYSFSVLQKEIQFSEERINKLKENIKNVLENIKELSNRYAIKLPQNFIQKMRAIKERKLDLIRPYVQAKLEKIRPTEPNVIIIKRIVDSMKDKEIDFARDVQPYLPAFEGIDTYDQFLEKVRNKEVKWKAQQYPYPVWKNQQWLFYALFVLYTNYSGGIIDTPYKDKLYQFITVFQHKLYLRSTENDSLSQLLDKAEEEAHIGIQELYNYINTYRTGYPHLYLGTRHLNYPEQRIHGLGYNP